jgi:hypothetical protein
MMQLSKVLRLVHFARFSSKVYSAFESRLSYTKGIVLKCLAILLGLIYYNHLVSCAYYLLYYLADSDTGEFWSDQMFDDTKFEEGRYAMYRYWTVFHWFFALMTVGNETVPASNSAERIFNCIGLMFALMLSCSLVSLLSATQVEYMIWTKDMNDKTRVLQNYLRVHGVSHHTFSLASKQLKIHFIRGENRITEDKVDALAYLSTKLRLAIRVEQFESHLQRHPLFQLLNRVHQPSHDVICWEAARFTFKNSQDEIFASDVEASAAYLVVSGKLQYVLKLPDSGNSRSFSSSLGDARGSGSSFEVESGRWLCEAALWVNWIHVGEAEALSVSQLMAIEYDGFKKALNRHNLVQELASGYALEFLKRVRNAQPPACNFPDDLDVPFTDYSEIVLGMPANLQVVIGLDAIQQLRIDKKIGRFIMEGPGGRGVILDKLQQEVLSGRSTLLISAAGEVERVASVIAFRLENEYGEVLAQIAKYEDGQMAAACQLPGGKQERGELPVDTMHRLLQTKLEPLKDLVYIVGTSQEVTAKASKDFNIRTKYMRTIGYSKVSRAEFNPPIVLCSLKRQSIDKSTRKSSIDSQSIGSLSKIKSSSYDIIESNGNSSESSTVIRDSGTVSANRERVSCDVDTIAEMPASISLGLGRRLFSRNSHNQFKKALSSASNVHFQASLQNMEIYPFRQPMEFKLAFYAWLSPEGFEHLSSPQGDSLLKELVEGIPFNRNEFESAYESEMSLLNSSSSGGGTGSHPVTHV